MFSPAQFWWEVAGWIAGYYFYWRHVVREEAATLIERQGPSAAETARQVARLARARQDRRSTWLWEAVAREITRRQAAKER